MSAQHPAPNFRLVRLVMAREPDHPAGDVHHGYRMVLPLTVDDRLDAGACRQHPDRCRIVREDPDGEHVGRLAHGPGGRWTLRYGENEEEHGFRFDLERFVPGEYVSIRRDDGDHTYRVVSQQPV